VLVWEVLKKRRHRKESAMPIYVTLLKFTEKGAVAGHAHRNLTKSVRRQAPRGPIAILLSRAPIAIPSKNAQRSATRVSASI
jgi:hypothetical protein